MKLPKTILALMLAVCLLTACSNRDDDTSEANTSNPLYAIVMPEGEQPAAISPDDYVLTLQNIIAVNPATGEFKVRDTQRMDSIAYPIPRQHVIQFHSEGSLLFEAKLNSVISSYLPSGLTFCHFLTDENGVARYSLGATHIVSPDGKMEGIPTEQQQQGMQRMYRILEEAGKTSSHIDY